MSHGHETWVDHDYPSLPRDWEKCPKCGDDLALTHHCAIEASQLRGMIWWLATELATDDVGKGGEPDTWVALAEKHWRLGIRSETRLINPD